MYVAVHVYPGMRREKVTELEVHSYELILKEPAARNLANQRAREIIASMYGVGISQVRQISGHRSQRKIFSLPDDTKDKTC